MRKSLIISSIFVSIASICNAIGITTTSGNLEKDLNGNTAITELSISGTIDVRDFKFINQELEKLTNLDLSNASITAFSGNIAYFGSSYNYAENAIPQLSMFGKQYTSVVLPYTITSIGDGALSGCTQLIAIAIPSKVSTIGEYAFYDCDKIETITIPTSVESIGDYAFAKCDNLAKAIINTNKSVSNYCFSNCEKLADVTMSANISSIGVGAFINSTSLKSVAFPAGLKTIAEDAFKGSRVENIDLAQCSVLTTIGKWAFADNNALSSIALPSSIESIGDGAFFYNTNLEKIALPSGVTTISDFLLTGCISIDPLTILNGNVEKIGKYTFRDWNQMAKFTIPASVKYIGDNAFENCSNLNVMAAEAVNAPELGEDVFKGVDQANVKLYVPTESGLIYKSALQWREFEVIAGPLGVDDATINDNIKIYFQDRALNINASSEIKTIRLFDMSGVNLITLNPNNISAQIDTDIYFASNYILTVELNNGNIQNFKLVRK